MPSSTEYVSRGSDAGTSISSCWKPGEKKTDCGFLSLEKQTRILASSRWENTNFGFYSRRKIWILAASCWKNTDLGL